MKQANESRSPFTLQSINGGGSAAKPQCRIEEYLNAIEAAWLGVTPLPAYPTEPVWRIELFLAAILSAVKGDDPPEPCPEPTRRQEEFLRAIYDEITGTSPAWPCPTQANTRIEEYLKAAYDRVANGMETPAPVPAWTIEELVAAAVEAIPVEQTYGPAALATFNAPTAKAMKSLLVSMGPIQDLHGYDNPWPSGGGKNKATAQFSDYNQYGITLTRVSSGVYTINGTNTKGSIIPLVANLDTPLPAGTYTFSANNDKVATNANVYIGFKTSGGVDPSADVRSYVNATKTYTVTQPITQLFISIFTGASFDNMTVKLQLETGSESTTFAPPENICPITGRTGANVYVSPPENVADATTYAVAFGDAGTVYGGTLDVVSGVLTVNRAIVDLGALTWHKTTDSEFGTIIFWAANSTLIKSTTVGTFDIPNAICSIYQPRRRCGNSSLIQSGLDGFNVNQDSVRVVDSTQASATEADFKTAMSGVQLCYELVTPVTYQLTPQQVDTLVGANNVWSDSGDVTVVV